MKAFQHLGQVVADKLARPALAVDEPHTKVRGRRLHQLDRLPRIEAPPRRRVAHRLSERSALVRESRAHWVLCRCHVTRPLWPRSRALVPPPIPCGSRLAPVTSLDIPDGPDLPSSPAHVRT